MQRSDVYAREYDESTERTSTNTYRMRLAVVGVDLLWSRPRFPGGDRRRDVTDVDVRCGLGGEQIPQDRRPSSVL